MFIVNLFVLCLRAVEILSNAQNDFERLRLDMEMEVRDLRYRLSQELETKVTVGDMNTQLKDQLKRTEEKLAAYVLAYEFT